VASVEHRHAVAPRVGSPIAGQVGQPWGRRGPRCSRGGQRQLADQGPLDYVARQHKKNAASAKVTCAVSIGPRDAGGFGLAVKMRVEDTSLPQAELEALAREAHEKICPYSHATRGNVPVEFEVVGS
jgi:hypothetical protein